MGRKTADAIAVSKKPYGRDAIWAAIRSLGQHDVRFTVPDVFDKCGHEINKATIRTYIDSLVNAHIVGVAVNSIGPGQAALYTLLKDQGAEAPRVRKDGAEVTQGLGTEAMWRTMKTLAAFTAGELALTASTSKAHINEASAKDYLKFMRRAGYVREVSKGAPGKPARYAFIRSHDPGPKPPQIQRIKQVFDPNSNAVVWPKGGAQ